MARLYRPSIPIGVKLRVVLRQLGEMFIDDVIRLNRFVPRETVNRRSHAKLLAEKLAELAELLGCEVKDLRLDHDPPLAARPQERRGLGKKTYYVPDANDPEHLNYRPHGAQFAGSHDVKTRIRGDHGQFSDIALIKRQRRRDRPPKPKRQSFRKGPKQKIPSRPFQRKK